MPEYRDERPVQDVENLETALQNLDEKNKVLHDLLVSLGLDYVNKIQGDFLGNHDVIFRLRDTILYRRDSFRFHLTLLLRTHNQADSILQSRIESPEEEEYPPDTMVMDRSARQQFAVFDSLLFHTISLFDYLAGLVKYLCGSEEKHDWYWKNAKGAAFHQDNNFSNTVVGKAIRELHKSFVQNLYDHRAEVIHYSADLGGRTLTETIGPEVEHRYDLKVFAPQEFVSQFTELKKIYETRDITLHYAALWLSRKTIDGAVKIVEALRKHVDENREVQEGKEPIKFELPDND